MLVTDLRNSFNPYPKPKDMNKNSKEAEQKVVKKIKQKSSKLAKKEKKRFSILQKNESKCFLCNKEQKKLDKHEAFGGSNRQKSMEYGLIYYLCRRCHKKADIDPIIRKYLHDFAKKKFNKKYGKEKFLEEFKNNYE